MDQNPSDVLPSGEPRIHRLVAENVNYSLVKLNFASHREIEDLFGCSPSGWFAPGLLGLVWFEAEVLNNGMRILEVPDEIDYCTVLFSDEPSQSASKLLEEYALRFSGPQKKKTLHKR